jgi:hypothetical protein
MYHRIRYLILAITLAMAANGCPVYGLIDTMESLGTFDLGLGNPLSLGTQEHQASHKIWWSEIRQGTVLPMQMVRNRTIG